MEIKLLKSRNRTQVNCLEGSYAHYYTTITISLHHLVSTSLSFLGEFKYVLVVLRTEKLLFVYNYTPPVVGGARLFHS